MGFRIGRDRDIEIRHPRYPGDQFRRTPVSARGRLPLAAARHVAAQCNDATDAHFPPRPRQCVDLFPRRADAGQMGCQRHLPGQKPLNQPQGALLPRTVGAIGHRQEVRPKRHQLVQGLVQRRVTLRRFRWKNLETDPGHIRHVSGPLPAILVFPVQGVVGGALRGPQADGQRVALQDNRLARRKPDRLEPARDLTSASWKPRRRC